ncbi:MAG: hypothetical protein PUJ51_17970 [Clostridiales bacterium]|uniref:hypothetical protein n=1 Tax=Terrisporobacter sp. TaxID=1965305 RepID=UPI002A509BEB|nr:hypothetical protein [Terrisporobacter sp.]MDD7756376.1 hypothetical protein [Clostridiales bacterium]MDY4135628.1 hypothetical protein [Terrisporobacter sp.]
MKRFLIICILACVSIISNAQPSLIFTRKIIFDKFDDVVFDENIKTLVTIYSDVIFIEEKGDYPIELKVGDIVDVRGDKDNIVKLYDNIYGYQAVCLCYTDNGTFLLTYRVVADKYSRTVTDEMVWVEGSNFRIVYTREIK